MQTQLQSLKGEESPSYLDKPLTVFGESAWLAANKLRQEKGKEKGKEKEDGYKVRHRK